MKKVLIIRFSSFGDILLATPVLSAIKAKYPDCLIDWVLKDKFIDAVKTNSLINKIYSFTSSSELQEVRSEISNESYDLIVDLQKNLKSFRLTKGLSNICRFNKRLFEKLFLVSFKKNISVLPVKELYFSALKKAGVELDTTPPPTLEIPDEDENSIKSIVTFKDYAVIVPAASYETKMWCKEYFSEVVKFLNNNNIPVILLGHGENEDTICDFIESQNEKEKVLNLSSKLSFLQSGAVIKNSKFVISNDTGLMHVAECFKVPVLAMFGCTTEELGFYPYETDYHVFEVKNLKCRPCTMFGKHSCPKKHFKCMKEITPAQVISVIKDKFL